MSDNIVLPEIVDFDYVTALNKEFADISLTEVDDVIDSAVLNLINDYEEKELQISNEDIVEKLTQSELNLNNYAEILHLNLYNIDNVITDFDRKIQKIVYKDINENVIAIVRMNFQQKQLDIEFWGEVFPKQEYLTPQEVNNSVVQKAYKNGWTIEDGGINQFNGDVELRYKDSKNRVMSAIIFTTSKRVDTIVEYFYIDDKKSKMVHTGQLGQTTTVYNTENDMLQMLSIEIDIDGNVRRVTKNFEN